MTGPDTEPPPASEGQDEPDEQPRRFPQTFGGVVFLVVVAMTMVGLGITVAGPWRTGLRWMGVAVILGALARSVLSERGAGMLRVRRRWTDVITLGGAGIALLVLAVVVPDQPS